MDDMKTFCNLFYMAHYIPLVCIRGEEPDIMFEYPEFFPKSWPWYDIWKSCLLILASIPMVI